MLLRSTWNVVDFFIFGLFCYFSILRFERDSIFIREDKKRRCILFDVNLKPKHGQNLLQITDTCNEIKVASTGVMALHVMKW